ncbi:MAG: hypothetical protein KF752_11905 [Pirellulaceae bacterium]|nr:hypothetical protein [Pirellulaceae bacterium]
MFNQLASLLNIHRPSDWTRVTPEQVLSQPRTGDRTLLSLRTWLAKQNLSLLGDLPPEYWLSQSAGKSVVSPFTILIDTGEQHPFTFSNLQAGAAQDYRPIVVRSHRQALGVSRGDYSIDGFTGQIHIERKSMEDAHSTMLGWGDRRERFEATLSFLNQIDFGAVVVECTLGTLLSGAPEHGKRSKVENRRALNSTYLSWIMKFSSVHWLFCDTRGLAETETYRLLEKFYAHKLRQRKAAATKSKTFQSDLSLV